MGACSNTFLKPLRIYSYFMNILQRPEGTKCEMQHFDVYPVEAAVWDALLRSVAQIYL